MRPRISLDADLISHRWNARTARKVLAAWRASGASQAAFGREHGIGTWRLGWWRKRLEETTDAERTKKRGASSLAPIVFVPATVTRSGPARPIAVRLPGGVEVEAGDVSALPTAWLGALVRELGRRP